MLYVLFALMQKEPKKSRLQKKWLKMIHYATRCRASGERLSLAQFIISRVFILVAQYGRPFRPVVC
jgi:hypothetical protein